MCAQLHSVSSEVVALSAPVEPVFDCLPGFVISIDHFELGERNRQTFLIPAHYDEHLVFAFLHGSHADHFDLISYLQGGGGSSGGTPGEEGEVELPFEVVVLTYGPFLLVVSIDNDLHEDPVLSGFIRFDLRSSKPLDHCKPLHPCGPFTPYHKLSDLDAQPPKCGHIRRSTIGVAASVRTLAAFARLVAAGEP